MQGRTPRRRPEKNRPFFLLHALAKAHALAPPAQEPPDNDVAAAFMLSQLLAELPDAAAGASSGDVQMAAATDDAA